HFHSTYAGRLSAHGRCCVRSFGRTVGAGVLPAMLRPAAGTATSAVKALRDCCAWTKGTHAVKANSRIRPKAKFFFDGEKKFFVKGVTYGPFKPDAEGHYLGRPEQVDVDLAL